MSLYYMTKMGYGHRKHLKFPKRPELKMEKWLVHTGMSMHFLSCHLHLSSNPKKSHAPHVSLHLLP